MSSQGDPGMTGDPGTPGDQGMIGEQGENVSANAFWERERTSCRWKYYM